MDLFQHDIFRNQKVPVGDFLRYSRHFVTETRGPAKLSVVPTKEVEPSEEVTPTGLPDVEIHLQAETERGQQERQQSDAVEDVITPAPPEQVEEHLHQTVQNIIQTEELDEFDDIAKLAEEMWEELEEPQEDTSVCRRFLNWLNELLADCSRRKIAKTYRRELEEGDEIYRSKIYIFYSFYSML